MQWLRRSFIAGFFVTVPLVISVATFVWIFRLIDGFVGPFYAAWLNRNVPGLGILTTALAVLLVGAVATNVIGKRLLQKTEGYLLLVPVFRTIYAPVKQLIVAFSPDNEYGFKRVVLVEEPGGGSLLGFLTREFTVDRGHGPEPHGGRVRANEPPLPWRRDRVCPRKGVVPGHHSGTGDPDFPHRRRCIVEPDQGAAG